MRMFRSCLMEDHRALRDIVAECDSHEYFSVHSEVMELGGIRAAADGS